MNLEVIVLGIFLLASAFFSSMETAMISLSKIRVRSLLNERKAGAKDLYKLKKDPHKLLITLLIGNNTVNIAAASLATSLAIKVFGDTGIGVASGVMTLLILVFGEIVPKSVAVQNAEKISLIGAKLVIFLEILLSPVLYLFESLTHLITKSEATKTLTESELRAAITLSAEEGLLDQEAIERLNSVLDFERATVSQIMTPSAQVISFAASTTIEQFLDYIYDTPYDRYPIFEGNPKNIIGIVDVVDVIRAIKKDQFKTSLREIKKQTFFVKQNTRLDEIITQFRPRKTSMGIVVDNNNQMVGLFTSQDIVEEIVGDIFEKEVYKKRDVENIL